MQLGQMHLTLGLAFQSASADPGNFQKAQLHLQKAKKIWEAHAPKAAVRFMLHSPATAFFDSAVLI